MSAYFGYSQKILGRSARELLVRRKIANPPLATQLWATGDLIVDEYNLGKDIQEIKCRLDRIEAELSTCGPATQAPDPVDRTGPISTLGERMRLNLSNHALLDLWVVWSNDTHQAPQTDFMPNGSTQERKSRKVDVLDGAYFTIEVFKNNNGTQGDKIGHFTDNVYGYDHVEFLVVDVNGQNYFKAISLVTIGKVLLYVLL